LSLAGSGGLQGVFLGQIPAFVDVALFQVGQNLNKPAGPTVAAGDAKRWQLFRGVVVAMDGKSNLLEVILTLGAGRRLARFFFLFP